MENKTIKTKNGAQLVAPENKIENGVFGLCQGRHEIPEVTEYIFVNEIDPLDLMGIKNQVVEKLNSYVYGNLTVYVTGLTVALAEVINFCIKYQIALTLMHFDRDSNSYYPQVVNTTLFQRELEEGGYL